MVISVHAKPNSALDKIELKDGIFNIKLKAKPVNGEANEYLIKFLSKFFSISQSSIQIIKGHTSKNKIINIDINEAEFMNKTSQL